MSFGLCGVLLEEGQKLTVLDGQTDRWSLSTNSPTRTILVSRVKRNGANNQLTRPTSSAANNTYPMNTSDHNQKPLPLLR